MKYWGVTLLTNDVILHRHLFLPVGLWPLTVTVKAPVLECPSCGTLSLGWFTFIIVAAIATMVLQLSSPQQGEKTANPRFESRSKRGRQLTVRGVISIAVITITVGSVAKRPSTTEKTLLRMMIIDEHFHFYRWR